MVKITSAKLQRQFGRFRDMARREPVSVTHHGRDDLVVLSAEEYKRLKSYDDRQSLHAWELPEEAIQALETVEVPTEAAQFHHEYK